MKRANKELRKLKTSLGRVTRDIIRKLAEPDAELDKLLCLSKRLLKQICSQITRSFFPHIASGF